MSSQLNRFKNFILRKNDPMDRVKQGFDRLSTEAGLTPLYKDSMVEVRRKELIDALHEINELEFNIMKQQIKDSKGAITERVTINRLLDDYHFKAFKLARLFQLFFVVGDPWARGLDNSVLSRVVADYITQFEDVGHLTGFVNMLTSEAYQMVHLAWQKIDVDIMPPMLLSSQPLLINQPNRGTPRYEKADSKSNQGFEQE